LGTSQSQKGGEKKKAGSGRQPSNKPLELLGQQTFVLTGAADQVLALWGFLRGGTIGPYPAGQRLDKVIRRDVELYLLRIALKREREELKGD